MFRPYGTAVVEEAVDELTRARKIHGGQPFNSAHEGFAVLVEEVDELWNEVKKREHDPVAMRKEAIQVAAMAIRFALECGAKYAVTGPDAGKWDSTKQR